MSDYKRKQPGPVLGAIPHLVDGLFLLVVTIAAFAVVPTWALLFLAGVIAVGVTRK